MKLLRWSKVALGEWHGYRTAVLTPTPVAVAVKTGTHLDHYPWDWYLTDYGVSLVPDAPLPCRLGPDCKHGPRAHTRHHAGVTDTLRAAKEEVEMTLALPGDSGGPTG